MNWPLRRFGDLAKNCDAQRIPLKKADREARNGPIPYYGASGVIDFVDEHIFEGKHLLIGEDGANLLSRTSPIAFIVNEKFWANNHAHILTHNGEADLDYLARYIEATDLKPYVTGSAQPKLNQKNLNEIMVPCPPLDEQRRIAAILDQADALRRLRQSAIDKLNTLGQAIFYEMFGDPFANKNSNLTVKLEELTTRITYGFTCPMSHHESGVPILTAKNVRDGYIDLSTCKFADRSEFDALTSKSKPEQGDLLITKDGTIGRYSVFDEDFPVCINQSVALVKPDFTRVVPAFLAAYIGSSGVQSRFQNMKKGNALPHLQITELAGFPIFCPPLGEQEELKNRVTAISEIKKSEENHAMKAGTLFSSLQQRAFSGKL